MKCPRCGNEMKLVAEKLHPRRAHTWGEESGGSITYRDVYYCVTCDKCAIARVNLRMSIDDWTIG